MSLSSHPQESEVRTDKCARDGCNREFGVGDAVEGSFCSHECFLRERGERVLRQLENDHHICGTCFAILKETTGPPGEWRERHADPVEAAIDDGAVFVQVGDDLVLDATDCDRSELTAVDSVIGYQTLTEHAERGLRSLRSEDASDRSVWTSICECGNTDHRHHEPVFDGADARRRANNLLHVLDHLYAIGSLHHRVDRSAVIENIVVEGELSWTRAIGAGLEEGRPR